MASFDTAGIPRCTIDIPLEISPEEIAGVETCGLLSCLENDPAS